MAVETRYTTDGRDRELWEADNEGGIAESIECFIEGQATSQSYCFGSSVALSSSPTLPSVSPTGDTQED